MLLNYTCECLGNSYTGRHCEIKASQLAAHEALSKSFAYVAICALLGLAVFIVTMDVLKYGFHIDPAREERERLRRLRAKKHTYIRFIYVH